MDTIWADSEVLEPCSYTLISDTEETGSLNLISTLDKSTASAVSIAVNLSSTKRPSERIWARVTTSPSISFCTMMSPVRELDVMAA